MAGLAETLNAYAQRGDLWERLDERRIRCLACAHRCPIFEGQPGVCKVRFNRGGVLYVPWGYAAAIQVDPIEKKPFFHVLPGAAAFSFGMLGCDLHCSYCQNWITSQALRDPAAGSPITAVTAEQMAASAAASGAQVIVSTYNEPLITAEWAAAIFRLARQAGLLTGFVSNGNVTREALQYLRPHLDLYKADLKSFQDRRYRQLGGRLQPVLDGLRMIHAMGFWLEVVTLLVPGFNDSREELQEMAAFLAGISADIPWHVTAFHRDYRMREPSDTTAQMLIRAAEIGRQAGLRYVYAGNLPGQVGDLENTNCPQCGLALIERSGFVVRAVRITDEGKCPQCGRAIPGVWRAPACSRPESGADWWGQQAAAPGP